MSLRWGEVLWWWCNSTPPNQSCRRVHNNWSTSEQKYQEVLDNTSAEGEVKELKESTMRWGALMMMQYLSPSGVKDTWNDLHLFLTYSITVIWIKLFSLWTKSREIFYGTCPQAPQAALRCIKSYLTLVMSGGRPKLKNRMFGLGKKIYWVNFF